VEQTQITAEADAHHSQVGVMENPPAMNVAVTAETRKNNRTGVVAALTRQLDLLIRESLRRRRRRVRNRVSSQ
jgi:hypothetical protein